MADRRHLILQRGKGFVIANCFSRQLGATAALKIEFFKGL